MIILCNRTDEHLPRVADKAAALVLGTQSGTWTKLGANRYQRGASGNTLATEFTFSTGLDGQGASLTQVGRSLRRVD